jgi:DNA-binding transcriptional MocR family regulator
MRVPAERELAVALDVSRTTVAAAYESLRDAGILHSRRGAGSWTQLPDGSGGGGMTSPFSPHGDRTLFDLAHAAPPAPAAEVRRAAASAVEDLDAHLGGHGYDLLGQSVLRAAIARRFTRRGLPTTPDQVLVTAGGQAALSLVLAALVSPGDRVLVEHPTYPNALDAVTGRGGRCVPLPMDLTTTAADAWDLDLVAATLRDAVPRLAYLVPDYQNPTGALLDGAGRERLVALARRTGTPLLIDETLAELALSDPAEQPVAAHGAVDSPLVITIGSAAKVLWGGLRIGWIRTSAPLVRRLGALRASTDLGGPVLEQLVAARLVDGLDPIVLARRAELTAARDHLLGRLGDAFPGWRPSRPSGGLSLWVDLGAPVSSRLVGAARRYDVLLAAGPRFGLAGAFERYLRVPYTLRRERVEQALDRLVAAWHTLDEAVPDTEPSAVA